MVLEALAPSHNSSPFVEEHPEESAASSQDQVEGAIPVHGLRVRKVADPAEHSVINSIGVVAATHLGVSHTCSNFF